MWITVNTAVQHGTCPMNTVIVYSTINCTHRYCVAGNRSWLLVVFPRHKNNVVENIWCTVLQLCVRFENF
jgi:hypothetical protein